MLSGTVRRSTGGCGEYAVKFGEALVSQHRAVLSRLGSNLWALG